MIERIVLDVRANRLHDRLQTRTRLMRCPQVHALRSRKQLDSENMRYVLRNITKLRAANVAMETWSS